jgi:ribosomal protein S18 acetylase RimI-like enzyme
MSSHPLSATSYRLANCELRLLESGLAEPIAEQLARLHPWLTLGYSATGLRNYLSSDDAHLKRYAIMQAGEVAGVVCVRYPWLRGIYLELIGIFPPAQQRGIGGQVMKWLENQVNGQSNGNVWALVSEFNWPARQFYQHCGFVTIGVIDSLVKKDFNEILVRKQVTRPQ